MEPVVDTRPLFPLLARELNSLLTTLRKDEWHTPTICPDWTVKDIVAHLLDTSLRRLSFHRDGMPLPEPDVPVDSYEDLVRFLNTLNAQWVLATRRLSPDVLTESLYRTQMEVVRFFNGLDLSQPAFFPVAWAGEAESSCRFDIAREYTEWWIHQAQIRLALNRPGLMSRQLFCPMVDTLMRALPHHYRDTAAPAGSTVRVTVGRPAGGTWTIERTGEHWEWAALDPDLPATATIRMEPETAWKLMSKSLHGEAARRHLVMEGDQALATPLTRLVSVMA